MHLGYTMSRRSQSGKTLVSDSVRRIYLREKHAVELFAGGGGFSCGMKCAGVSIIEAVERDPHAATTFRANHPDVNMIQEDVRDVSPKDMLRRLKTRPGELFALVAGLPCQGFSESNRRTRTTSNPQNQLYKEFFRFLDVLLPRWFVIENVSGMRTLASSKCIKAIERLARNCGYEVGWSLLNAADYGVPQVRRRIFIVGNRIRQPIDFPKATHGVRLLPYVTVRHAIGDLPIIRCGASDRERDYRPVLKLTHYQERMRQNTNGSVSNNAVTASSDLILSRYAAIQPGQNWQVIPRRLMNNYGDVTRCHTGIYYRLRWDEPSKVIGNFRKNMLIHPAQNRGLSVREAARLQSFPDDYKFYGSIGFQQQQVGDAVPPLLAQVVTERIVQADNEWCAAQARKLCVAKRVRSNGRSKMR